MMNMKIYFKKSGLQIVDPDIRDFTATIISRWSPRDSRTVLGDVLGLQWASWPAWWA